MEFGGGCKRCPQIEVEFAESSRDGDEETKEIVLRIFESYFNLLCILAELY